MIAPAFDNFLDEEPVNATRDDLGKDELLLCVGMVVAIVVRGLFSDCVLH